MLYDHRTIVNWLFNEAHARKATLSRTQAIKLAYIAHGWYLERFNRPLIKSKLEAWDFGAVFPAITQDYPSVRNRIEGPAPVTDKPLSRQAEEHLRIIVKIYDGQTPFDLSALIKEPGGAWHQAIKHGAFSIIGPELIRRHFMAIRAAA